VHCKQISKPKHLSLSSLSSNIPLMEHTDDTPSPHSKQSFQSRISREAPYTKVQEQVICRTMYIERYPIYLLLWMVGYRYLPPEYKDRLAECPLQPFSSFLLDGQAKEDSYPNPLELEVIAANLSSPEPPVFTLRGLTTLGEARQESYPNFFAQATPKAIQVAVDQCTPVLDLYIKHRKNFLVHNLRLVLHISNKFHPSDNVFMDYIQEGAKGLSHAIDRFSYSRGHKFSTYATWWIRQQITRHIADNANTIRLPQHIQDLRAKLYNFSTEYTEQHGKDPSIALLATTFKTTPTRIQTLLDMQPRAVSLNAPTGSEDGEGAELADRIEDHTVISPAEVASMHLLRTKVRQVLEDLPARERNVLSLRFGLDDGQKHTLEEVGRTLHVTRERIRQIEAKALKKLRHPRRIRMLRGDPEN
jgi:RNA polymerase sigma factor (sigma-70 family)